MGAAVGSSVHSQIRDHRREVGAGGWGGCDEESEERNEHRKAPHDPPPAAQGVVARIFPISI
jgi:hypothetical protein